MDLRKKFKALWRVERKMHQKAMLVLFAFLFLTMQPQAGAVDEQALRKCLPNVESRLGKPATNEAPIYSLSATYAIELEFDKACQIISIEIAPKYFWETKIPEWVEPRSAPELNLSEYEEFLAKASQLRTIGTLIRKGDSKISVVTNSKQYAWDEYEHVFIKRVMHCCDDKSVFSAYLYFRQRVEGKIEKVR
jgi:hypothetical protein